MRNAFTIFLALILIITGIFTVSIANDLGNTRSKNLSLTEQVISLTDKNKNLLEEINSLSEDKKLLSNQINAKLVEIEDLNNQLTIKEEELLQANLFITNLQIQLEDCIKTNNEQVLLISQYEEQIQSLEADIQALNMQIERIMGENQAEIDRLNALVNSKQSELDIANASIVELQGFITDRDNEITRLNDLNVELQSVVEDLNNQIIELDKQLGIKQSELDSCYITISDLNNEIARLNNELNLLHENNIHLEYELINYQAKVGAVELLNIPVNPLSDFEIADGKIIKYLGNSDKINIPTSYSLGELVDSIKYFDSNYDLENYIRDKYGFEEFEELTVVNDMGESYTFNSYMELIELQDYLHYNLELHYLAPEIIPGSDIVINEIASYSLTGSSVEYLYIPDCITVINDLPYSLQYVRLPNTINDISVKFDTLKYLKIPASVTNISSNSLYLSKINVIEVASDNEYYTSQDINGNELNCLMDKSRTTLYAVGSTFNLDDLPDTVTTLAYNCLNNYKVSNVVIPSHVVNYESRIFDVWNTYIESIEIQSIPEVIDKDAFSHCSKLNTLILNVNTVVDYSLLSNLAASTGGASLFTKITAIYVPSGLVDSYKLADGWSDYADIIKAI